MRTEMKDLEKQWMEGRIRCKQKYPCTIYLQGCFKSFGLIQRT